MLPEFGAFGCEIGTAQISSVIRHFFGGFEIVRLFQAAGRCLLATYSLPIVRMNDRKFFSAPATSLRRSPNIPWLRVSPISTKRLIAPAIQTLHTQRWSVLRNGRAAGNGRADQC